MSKKKRRTGRNGEGKIKKIANNNVRIGREAECQVQKQGGVSEKFFVSKADGGMS